MHPNYLFLDLTHVNQRIEAMHTVVLSTENGMKINSNWMGYRNFIKIMYIDGRIWQNLMSLLSYEIWVNREKKKKTNAYE